MNRNPLITQQLTGYLRVFPYACDTVARTPAEAGGNSLSADMRKRGGARRRSRATGVGGLMAIDMAMPVLVVDDYNTMIRIIPNLLKQLGFDDIDDATDGTAALAKMHNKRYGLVISDWNMEPM